MMGNEYYIYLACFTVEVLKYIYGIGLVFNQQLKRYYLILIALVTYSIVSINIGATEIILVMYPCVYIAVFFLIDAPIKRKFVVLVLGLAFINCLDQIVTVLLMRFLRLSNHMDTLISSFICLVIILLIGLIKRQISFKDITSYKCFQRKVYILIPIMVLSVLSVDALLSVISNKINDTLIKNVSLMISIISIASLLIIVILVVSLLKINEWMELSVENEREFHRTQKMYYEALLDREYDTRKYRHDTLNHYICLEGYLKSHEYDKAENYLQAIRNDIEKIHGRIYFCGNQVIDSLLNYYVSLLDKNVDIQIKAKCSQKISICDTDLCVILGNLLQNAIESLLRENNELPVLKVQILQKDIHIFITVQNSVPIGYEGEMDYHMTKKGDKRNHGIGIRNITTCLKRYNGELEQECKEGMYTTRICIKYI